MSTVVAFSLLVGSLLGGRFRIFILPPVIVFGAAMIGVIAAWHEQEPARTVVTILVFATSLQLGYLCGAVLVRVLATAYRTRVASSYDSFN